MNDFNGELSKIGINSENFDRLWKDIKDKVNGTIDCDWSELVERYGLSVHPDTLRKACATKPFGAVFMTEYLASKSAETGASESYLNALRVERDMLEKERIKTRTENIEFNKWKREEARDELIVERIVDEVRNMSPLTVPSALPYTPNSDRYGLLAFADAHYGADFVIKGLCGEVLNKYSPEVFEERMWDLLAQTIHIVKKEDFDTISVVELGDSVDGLLRVSQLMKLKYGVLESAVRYGRFLTEWLNELSKYVRVRFQMTKDSNHNQLRMLGQPKNTFKDENVSLIIAEKLMDRLSDNPNFEFIQNPTGLVFERVVDCNILGTHGELKNPAKAIKEFSAVYKTEIDILLGAHLHHHFSECVGVASDIVNVPSLIGVDDFSMSLRKTSNAGASFLVIERGKGKVVDYNIKLN